MRRQIPGLHSRNQGTETGVSGVFLVRVDRAWYRRHPQKSFLELRFVVLEPQSSTNRSFTSRLYCTERALWKLYWFLRRTSPKTFRARSYQDLDSFAPAGEWEVLSCA